MPSPIANNWSLRKLIQATYHFFPNRFDNKERDVLHSIRIQKISVYDGKEPGEARTKFVVQSSSFPQYYPYFTRHDSRGRLRTCQRTYRHQYDVTIQLERLSIDTPVKLRTGADRRWDFTPQARAHKDRAGRIIESKNVKNGINGDFFFRLEWIYAHEGILFGHDWTNGPPHETNPMGVPFLDKHCLNVVERLMNMGYLSKDF